MKYPSAFRATPSPEALSFDMHQFAGSTFFALMKHTALTRGRGHSTPNETLREEISSWTLLGESLRLRRKLAPAIRAGKKLGLNRAFYEVGFCSRYGRDGIPGVWPGCSCLPGISLTRSLSPQFTFLMLFSTTRLTREGVQIRRGLLRLVSRVERNAIRV
jgi:hypothetical protein